MTNFHIFLFNETVRERFFGYNHEVSISELPVWGNFRIIDVLAISNMKELPLTTASLENSHDAHRILDLLNSDGISENIVIGRTGNILVLDWLSLTSRLESPKGIMKFQASKVPSEFYYMKKGDFIKILTDCEKSKKLGGRSVLHHVFDKVLFFNFERIIESSGFSFLMRNSYEYFKENLRIINHLLDSSFTQLYGALKVSSLSSTVVGTHAVVKNSVLGSGTKVDGVIEDSVIFNGVTVGRDTKIKCSVVLPSNEIEDNVCIENALVLGGTHRVIKRGTTIGSSIRISNRDFPEVIKDGLTIIGESITIPEGSQIGSGCLIQGKWERESSPLIVQDGMTFTVG